MPCDNPICNWDLKSRWYGRVRAIARDADPMRRVIRRYKYDDERAWAPILGRVLLGHLDRHEPEFRDYDLMVPSPAYTGDGSHRSWDHVDLIVRQAMIEDSYGWPFRRDPALVVKTAPTETMSRKGWRRRNQIATGPLRAALRVQDRAAVTGRRVLVIDDVFTTGHDMLEIARALRLAGAAAVDGLVLARAQWQNKV